MRSATPSEAEAFVREALDPLVKIQRIRLDKVAATRKPGGGLSVAFDWAARGKALRTTRIALE